MELFAIQMRNAKVNNASTILKAREKFVARIKIAHPLLFIQNLDVKMLRVNMLVNASLELVNKENVLLIKLAQSIIKRISVTDNFVKKMKSAILKIAFILCVLLPQNASQKQ